MRVIKCSHLQVLAILGLFSGLLILPVNIIYTFRISNLMSNIPVIMISVLGHHILSLFLLIGIYILLKDDRKWTTSLGFVLTLLPHIIIIVWLYTNKLQVENKLTIWIAIVYIFRTWGILLFGTAVIQTGRIPRIPIILWTVGTAFMATSAYQWIGAYYMITLGILWTSIYFLFNNGKKREINSPLSLKNDMGTRFFSLDFHRGLIMIIMAIDHASTCIRQSHPFEIWYSSVPSYFADIGNFLTRFVTHICAPGFFFLMGTSMVLLAESRKKMAWSQVRIIRHLLARGILIIALEKILYNPIINGNLSPTKFGVLFGLGGAMIMGAFLLRLNRILLLCIGVSGILVTQILPQFLMNIGFYNNPFMILFFVPQMGNWVNLYPIFPWLSITVFGIVFGKQLLIHSDKAYKQLLNAGLLCLLLFIIFRWIGGFGNLQTNDGSHWIDFLNVVKYPPSLVYTLMTLSITWILLFLFEKFKGRLEKWQIPFLVFGKTALYFYFVHWFLYSSLGIIFYFVKADLLFMYLGWIIGLLMLYPICFQYLTLKQHTSENELWRFI